MILGNSRLEKRIREIFPKQTLAPNQIQPASVDLTLGSDIILPTYGHVCQKPWDKEYMKKFDPHARLRLLDEKSDMFNTYNLDPGEFVLATTRETVHIPQDLCGEVWGKSSLARLGIQIHITAGLIDPGFTGQITLEIKNQGNYQVWLGAGMKIAQLVVKQVNGCSKPYSGKYQNQQGVTKCGGVT